jgi:putative SOS response-associated peptidase YedK
MCGRFTLRTPTPDLKRVFPQVSFPSASAVPRYNVAPTQPVLAVANDHHGEAETFRWGLVPSWAKDLKVGYKLINARAEQVASAPSFRSAYQRRHCAIFADGFYEWLPAARREPKVPYYFSLASSEPFAFAGLWEVWRPDEKSDWVRTCTVITTEANEIVRPVHGRMPVILLPGQIEGWLNAVGDHVANAAAFLQRFPAEAMRATRVSTAVNNVAHEGPELVDAT